MKKMIPKLLLAIVLAIGFLGFLPNHRSYAATTVIIQNMAFNPSALNIAPGTMVTWTNHDNVAHTVTSDTSGGPSSGQIQPGQSYSYTYHQAGTFSYHCSIHPQMKGSVTIAQMQPAAPAPAPSPSAPAPTGGVGGATAPTQPKAPLPGTGSKDGLVLLSLASMASLTYWLYNRHQDKNKV